MSKKPNRKESLRPTRLTADGEWVYFSNPDASAVLEDSLVHLITTLGAEIAKEKEKSSVEVSDQDRG